MTEEEKDIIECFRYLSNNDCRLWTGHSNVIWPDGSKSAGWIYDSKDTRALGKTLLETIKRHRDARS